MHTRKALFPFCFRGEDLGRPGSICYFASLFSLGHGPGFAIKERQAQLENLVQKARHRLSRLPRKALKAVFGFDQWHLIPLYERAYARDIIRYLNGSDWIEKGSVAEIGCGLGDILRRLRFRQRLGLDYEPGVLRALRFVKTAGFQRGLRTRVFHFPKDPLEGYYNAIIMVNWIHNVAPEPLKAALQDYFRNHLAPRGVILVDTVQAPSYKFHHSISALAEGLECTVERVGAYEPQREVFAIIKGR